VIAGDIGPYAWFDALALAAHLRQAQNDFLREELQLLGYLACLLSLYDGRPTADWRYQFASTPSGAPFSPSLDAAFARLVEEGHLQQSAELECSITEAGADELSELRALRMLTSREPYLEAASSSCLVVTPGMIRRAISQDPDIRAAFDMNSRRLLLDDKGLSFAYESLGVFQSALGNASVDLLAPALVWVTYFCQQSELDVS